MKKTISILLAALLIMALSACAAEEKEIEKPGRSVYKEDVQEYLADSVDDDAELSSLHVEDTEVDDDELIVECSVEYEVDGDEFGGTAKLTYSYNRGDWALEKCRFKPDEDEEADEDEADSREEDTPVIAAPEEEPSAEVVVPATGPAPETQPADPCEVNGHQWLDATYAAPKTCSVCGATEGQSLGIPLSDCEMVESTNASGNKDVVVGAWKDSFGTTHPDSVRFWVKEVSGYTDTEYGVFDLNAGYRTLTATIAAEMNNSSGAFTRFLVYADDVLIYESDEVYSGTQPFDITLDVEGVELLRVLCTTDSAEDAYGIFDGNLYQ